MVAVGPFSLPASRLPDFPRNLLEINSRKLKLRVRDGEEETENGKREHEHPWIKQVFRSLKQCTISKKKKGNLTFDLMK